MYKYNTSQDQVSESRTISATNLSDLLEDMQISGLIDAFNEENSHANIPTEQCPNGEIRGQSISLEIQMNTKVLYLGLLPLYFLSKSLDGF
jgi:hypothetical protein